MSLGFIALCLGVAGPAHAQTYPTDQGDLVVSEFMAEPEEVPNYYGEWFEIYNASGRNLDLNGVTITGTSSDDSGFTIDQSVTVASGGFVVLGVNGDEDLNGGITFDYVYSRGDFPLDEDDDTIKLSYGSVTLDSVTWDSSDWDITTTRSQQANKGNAYYNEWANDLYYNWCQGEASIQYEGQSTGMFGTPGTANNSCDGSAEDNDGDGYTPATGDCDDKDPDVNPEAIDGSEDPYGLANDDADCNGIRDSGDTDDDGDGYAEVEGDCDDRQEDINPEAEEYTDSEDNDCNGCVDDLDKDDDGWTECEGGYEPIECTPSAGEPFTIEEPYDCGEGDNLIYPCAPETPYNGVDEDCNGFDECDVDGDGYDSVDCPDENSDASDCDDSNANVNPSSTEGDPTAGGEADGLDNDCNGIIDDPYQDLDGDGWTVIEGDCLDDPADSRSPLVNPAAEELCDDTLDNDCNGFYNDGCDNDAGLAGVRGGGMVCGVSPTPGALGGSAVLVMLGALAVGLRRREETL